MPASDFTLEQFRVAAAGPRPTPAGVAVAAVSASLAFGLLAKVLRLSARRKDCPVAPDRLEPLIAAAQAQSARMLHLAEQDMTAVEAYMTALRVPRSTPQERERRRAALDAAVPQAIDLPLAAARTAADGLEMSGDALTLTPAALIADLGSVASLLAGALRTFLLCAESNARLFSPNAPSQRAALASTAERSQRALRQTDGLLERIAVTLGRLASTHPES